ncbi:MAG: acetyl-CoA C-acetyltransferase [Planctomycetes bacterium]|nr:acetyl-CoA C-acetyltransferase [Planctomycetota bacterium]NUQ35664.1 acetyl-CoA C-acetyltransferase [Planctomycetaceae bacterium]
MEHAVIVDAIRTPIGKFQGTLSGFEAPKLGAHVIKALLERAKLDPKLVDEVIMGNVLQAGLGQNPARQAALFAGMPNEVAAFTVNKVCGSGLKSVMLAAQAIRAGDIEIAVAGGQESMTNAPYLLPQARAGQRLGHGEIIDSMVHDGLWDKYNDFHMGMTGELVATEYKVSREDQDRYAAQSHARAIAAQKAGKFKDEIAALKIPQKKGDPLTFDTDEGPREDSTFESLSKLKPAFKRDGGSVTAGNASSINDGASALLVMSEKRASQLKLKPLARITGYATGGVEPKWVMMAPKAAVEKLNQKLGTKVGDYDLIELNEAFSVAAVALTRTLGIDPERINVNGGAVALGHPIGASGARILTTLLHELKRRKGKHGLAGLCLGGGNAVVVAVEML